MGDKIGFKTKGVLGDKLKTSCLYKYHWGWLEESQPGSLDSDCLEDSHIHLMQMHR